MVMAAVAIYATGCDELLADLLKFNGEWYTIDFTIDPEDNLGEIELISKTYEPNLDSLFEAEGLSRENLKSVKISDAEVSVVDTGNTFDPLSSIEVFMSTPGLGSTKVAWLDTVPPGVSKVVLDLNRDDLKAYLMEDEFTFTANGTLQSKVTEVVNLEARVRFVYRGNLETTPEP